MSAPDRHELQCADVDCRGRIHHLLDDAHELREAAGEVLSTSGFKDRVPPMVRTCPAAPASGIMWQRHQIRMINPR